MKISNIFKIISSIAFGSILFANVAIAGTKPTVVVVSSQACPMCVEFDNRVLKDAEVKKELSKFILKKVNANSTKIKVDVTPTVVIFDKNNKQIRKFVPSLDKAKFIEILKQAE